MCVCVCVRTRACVRACITDRSTQGWRVQALEQGGKEKVRSGRDEIGGREGQGEGVRVHTLSRSPSYTILNALKKRKERAFQGTSRMMVAFMPTKKALKHRERKMVMTRYIMRT